MDPISMIAAGLGIPLPTFLAYLGLVMAAANLIGRAIPDTAVGPLGVIRKACKILGLYLGNRVAPGVTNNAAAQAVLGIHGVGETLAVAEDVKNASKRGAEIGLSVENVIDSIRHPSSQPGRPYRDDDGSPLNGSPVPDEYRTDPFKAGAKALAESAPTATPTPTKKRGK